MKRILAIILSICILLSMVFGASAANMDVDINVGAAPTSVDMTEKTYTLPEMEGKYKAQGRTILQNDVLMAHYPATGIEFDAYCKGDVSVTFSVTNLGIDGLYFDGCYFTVIVDGVTQDRSTCHLTETGDVTVKIAEDLAEGNHTFELYRQNEIKYGYLGFKSVTLSGELLQAPANNDTYIEFVGASQWGGAGNLGDANSPIGTAETQDATQALTYLTARNLGADWSVVSVAGIGAYWCGLKYSMSTAYNYYGYENDNTTLYDFDNTRKPDYVVIGVGTNDVGKRGERTDEEITAAFNYFMRLMRIKNPNAKIIWVHGMMNDWATPFVEEAVAELGGAANGVYEVEVTSNNDGANVHPSAAGHKVIADEVTAFIKSIENDNFNTELPEIEYEEAKGETVLDLDLSSSSKWVPISSQVTYNDEDGDGTKDYVRLTTSTTANSGLRSAPFYLIPGNEYELSYYIRVPKESGAFFNTSKYYPTAALYIPTLDANGKATNNHYDSTNDYAYKNKIRSDFTSTWQIGQYAPVTRNHYSILHYTQACYQDSPNKALDDWTRVTLKFTALDDEANGAVGEQLTAIYFATNAKKNVDGLMYDIKDVKLVNTSVIVDSGDGDDSGATVNQTILTSDFNDADGTNWQGATVTYKDDNGDGVNDYASVKIGTSKDASLVSSPFNLVPGKDYELTYYIRVPEESKSFKVGSIFYSPTVAFYQPTVNAEGTRVTSAPTVDSTESRNNYYAYKGNGWTRRSNFTATWTIDGYDSYTRNVFSNFSYADHASVLSATNANLNAAFADWTKVTAKFTATAALEGETSQVTALAFYYLDYKSEENFVFDIKDVTLTAIGTIPEEPEDPETPDTPEYVEPVAPEGAVFYESFENATNESVAELITNRTWSTPKITTTEYASGTKGLELKAYWEYLFIPIDKSLLTAGQIYEFSMDWKLKVQTAEKNRQISQLVFVGYNPSQGEKINKSFLSSAGVFTYKQNIAATGDWVNTTLRFGSSDYNRKEQYGILLRYGSSEPYTSEEDTMYVDNIAIALVEEETPKKVDLKEQPRTDDTIKVLAFGNSFSNDSVTWLSEIAAADGKDLRVGNCVIGGCSLQRHYKNMFNGADDKYSFLYTTKEKDVNYKLSMQEALAATDWDYIVIQQVSQNSGMYETFEPFLEDLLAYFKTKCPDVKFLFHATWAYSQDSSHSGFNNYDKDQTTMHEAIEDAYLQASMKYGYVPIIPTGEAIRRARATSMGDNFTRDGFHLNDRGRLIAALTWYETITGISALDTKVDLTNNDIFKVSFETSGIEGYDGVELKGTALNITAEEALIMKTAAHEAAQLYKKANETQLAIEAIGEVDENSGAAIEKANNLRAELNDDELLPNLQTLIDANEAYAAFAPDTDVVAGDIDGNETVDLSDVVVLAQYAAGWDVICNETALDVDGSGQVDLNDVVLLAQYVAGWDVELA